VKLKHLLEADEKHTKFNYESPDPEEGEIHHPETGEPIGRYVKVRTVYEFHPAPHLIPKGDTPGEHASEFDVEHQDYGAGVPWHRAQQIMGHEHPEWMELKDQANEHITKRLREGFQKKG